VTQKEEEEEEEKDDDDDGSMNPRLNLSSVPPTDLSMASRRYVKIAPFNTGINPVDFQIDPQEHFIDLNDSLIELEIVLKKDNNTNLVAADQILPVNNLAHANRSSYD